MLTPVGPDGLRPSVPVSPLRLRLTWGVALVLLVVGAGVEPLAGALDPDLKRTLDYLAAPAASSPPDDLIEHFVTAGAVRFAGKLQGFACFLVWALYAPYLVLQRTFRSPETLVEVRRALVLASFPCLLAIYLGLKAVAPIAARHEVEAPAQLLVPLPYALSGTFCLVALLWALWVRFTHPLPPAPDEPQQGAPDPAPPAS